MYQKLLTLVGIAVFGICLTAPKAEAETIRIRLDNWLNPSKDSVAQSGNNITVAIHLSNSLGSWWEPGIVRKMNSISSSWDFVFNPSGNNAWEVDKVSIGTDGGDLMVLDQLEVIGADGSLVWSRGVDNETGWCFSTETSDGTNSHCDSSGATFSRTLNKL